MSPFRVRAVNTAADSENKIHDNAIAADYGFRGGLVPGVTVYGYLAAAVLEHLGRPWLERGAMDVRFFQPVYEGEEVDVVLHPEAADRVRAEIGSCASGLAWLSDDGPLLDEYPERSLGERIPASHEALVPGVVLGTLVEKLTLSEARMSAPLDAAIGANRLAHPAILLALANQILVRNFILGPWIHTASEVRNLSAARDGEELQVRGKIEDRYARKGHEFVVLGVRILAEGNRPVAQIRHTAIWRPHPI